MANDTTLVYTRTMDQQTTVRRDVVVTTMRHQVVRIDPRTGQPDLTTRTMAEIIQVRPLPGNIWSRA